VTSVTKPPWMIVPRRCPARSLRPPLVSSRGRRAAPGLSGLAGKLLVRPRVGLSSHMSAPGGPTGPRLLSVHRPGGLSAACHACPVLIRPAAHHRIIMIIPSSRAAPCEACGGDSGAVSPSRPPFALAPPQSLLVGRSAARRRGARIAGKRPVPTRPGTRIAFFSSVRGGARCARTATAAWFLQARLAPN
jgi:hypothetical protein